MARRNRDLAGLAALGALGMYMARDGKPDGSKVPVEDRRAAVQTPAAQDAGFEDTRGMESGIEPLGLRRNTETGDLYDPTGRVLGRPDIRQRPVVSTPGGRVPSATSGKAPAATRSMEGPRRNAAGDYTRKMGATAEEIAAYNRSQQTAGTYTKPREGVTQASTRGMARPDLSTPEGRKKAEQDQALERVTPEEMLIGGPGLKGLHTAAKALANRGSKPLKELVQIPAESRAALPAPQARLTGPSKGEVTASQRAAREAERRAETARENAARYNTEGPLGGEGFVMYKKGGAVKAKKMASGGMTSASKRADGIASRGKTKCKIY